MTLGNLVRNTVVQSNVKLKKVDAAGNTIAEKTFDAVSDISEYKLYSWESLEIQYIYADAFGYLVIEFEEEE